MKIMDTGLKFNLAENGVPALNRVARKFLRGKARPRYRRGSG